MDLQSWTDRLYGDESLTDNLTDDQAGQLLAWAAGRLEHAASDADAEGIVAAIRRLNRESGDGRHFNELMAALDTDTSGGTG